MNATAVAGLLLMIVSEAGTLGRIEPFWSWNTPIAWTGFILFADAVVWRSRGDSWIRSAPQEFLLLSAVSVPLWLVFEFYNRFIDNWYYTGLPENTALRMFGYAWSFSTIWPAIFEGAELVGVLTPGRWGDRWSDGRVGRLGGAWRGPTGPATSAGANASVGSGWFGIAIATGIVMLAAPFFVTRAVARYMAAPVWLGFIFLLDPINAKLGQESLAGDFRSGRYDRLWNLATSGFLCGILWEFWNYWSRAKWHYTVPIMEQTKIFEMPLPGFLGFPAFAVECFTMYVFVRAVFRVRGRAVAL